MCASENMVIHGDNLIVLESLFPDYEGEVKCVYIDPPYNTGKRDRLYRDSFGSSEWCDMMECRLELLRGLLCVEGSIFVSIDDGEYHRLRLLMDKVFGVENFIATFVWQNKYTLTNDSKLVSYQHEYVLAYARDLSVFQMGILPRTVEMDSRYKNPDNDSRGDWKSTPLHAKSGSEKSKYSVTFSNGVKWCCPPGTFPRYKLSRLMELYYDGRLYFGKTGGSKPRRKTYLNEVRQGKAVGSLWTYKEFGSSHEANEEFAAIMGKGVFDNPKPVRLIKKILNVANVCGSDIVLDAFAGSGTTGHAVLSLNEDDGGDRRFIMIEKEDYVKSITAERIRRLGGRFFYEATGE